MYKIKLSPYHKIFYNEWQLNPLSSQYNIVFDQTIANTLDIVRLKGALERLIAEHIILNSHIIAIDVEPYWVANSTIRHLDVFNDVATYDQIYAYVSQPFNIMDEPLYRFAIFNQADGTYRFILVWHHLIMDGAFGNEPFDLISAYYNNNTYKIETSLDKQYIAINTTTLKLQEQLQEDATNNNDFWINFLKNTEPVDLSFLKPTLCEQVDNLESTKNPIHEIRFTLSGKDIAESTQMIRKYGVTPYMYSQCIFSLLIYHYTNQNQFGFCYPISIKEHLGLIFGVAINTNIHCCNIAPNNSILELLNQNKMVTNKLKNRENNYRYYPINELMIKINKNMLDTFFIQSNFKDSAFAFKNAPVLKINTDFNIDLTSKLLFEQEYCNGKLNFRVRYNITETDETILKQFVYHYQKLFTDVLFDLEQGNINKCISEYNILTIQQYNKIVYEWNNTDMSYQSDKTIHKLFEEQTLKTPNNVAIVYDGIRLTYQELNRRANQLAHYIKDKYSIHPENLVALYLEKNEHIIIAILAVLKSGGAYVPMDQNYPIERIQYILKDTNAKILLTNKTILNNKTIKEIQSSFLDIPFMIIDDTNIASQLTKQPDTNINTHMNSTNLAYVIYTSGTTGSPKGVLQQHNNVARLFTSTDSWFKFNDDDVWVLFHSYVFDFSVWEIWGSLLYGGKLVIPNQAQIRDFKYLYQLIMTENITVFNQTPSSFYQFSQIAIEQSVKQKLTSLRYVIFGGEALNFAQLKLWFNYYTNMPQLINMYGITETTVHVTYQPINAQTISNISLIGKAIPDQKVYILDKLLKPLPIGAIGELYIGGAGLARGYINKEELTQERFISNPFQTIEEKNQAKNARLYKTGDLCRFLPDGNIQYIARNDNQIKIRGYRIELPEIEHKLNECTGIKQSVVLYRNISENSDNTYLVAYYVATEKLDDAEIIKQLAKSLPQYMIPNIFIQIELIPLTINGKLDKSSLPLPNLTTDKNNFTAPKNELEQIICKIFSDILSISMTQIDVNSDFFQLGGNSLLAISLVANLQQHNLKISVDEIFNLRTPLKISTNIKYDKNYLNKQFYNIKMMYHKINNPAEKDIIAMSKKKEHYLQSIKKLHVQKSIKPMVNVLLTGSTGYLGCNILYQLLFTTCYNIVLLIRSSSNDNAYQRLKDKFNFYFNKNIDIYKDRIQVYASDITKDDLGLSKNNYIGLTQIIDSIIHSAALVQHYGHYDTFYQVNVKATKNLLEFVKLTKTKEFHYISTTSIFIDGYIPECSYYSYTEDDNKDKLMRGCSNIYCQTKYEGEQIVIESRKHNVTSNIYRVGNLSINSQTYKNQENIEDNAFFIRMKAILYLGIIPHELTQVEISPVDCTASAIVKLFQQKSYTNNIYHVFNPHKVDLFELFMQYNNINIRITLLDEFIYIIHNQLTQDKQNKLIELFMLHQGWLRDINLEMLTHIEVLQNKTEYILSQLGFKWPYINSTMLSEIISKSFGGKN